MIGFLALAFVQAPAASVEVPSQPALSQIIAARDAEFFALFFEGCDPVRLRKMIADDVEFYHDKGGLLFTNAESMVADYAKNCAARQQPDAWRSRRELVRSSLHVDPVPRHGAFEVGEHVFHERKGSGPEKLVGRGRFAIIWKLDGGTWKLSRALSFAHGSATP
ncbi:nuclear transport factor 2 family protein [Sphingomonas lutea]|uniref:Nuclear transport factor 2 family protein n=1 Tax=Sphingomonas lutea TaxID=1045317 RepID=A0A7G9SG36_9SPHN|nr:nuclear transport factor 2 family protein [Sphingomonas lutea]QNN66811.1 nuclear transport factor 2 family protein [Sphingomonas lutea]